MSTVTSRDGTTIAYERSGDGPAIILVEGAMCFRRFGPGAPLVPLLERDFTVYQYDRRGRGESGDGAAFSPEREIEDLAALIDEAGGKAGVFGHSSGAILALEAAAHGAGITRLALFEPPVDAGGDETRDLPERLDELVKAGRRGDAVELFQTAIGIPAEARAGMRRSPFWTTLEDIAHTLVYDSVIAGEAATGRYASVAVPTLVIDSLATNERLRASARAVAETVADGRYESLPGEYHQVAPETIAPVLAGFFG